MLAVLEVSTADVERIERHSLVHNMLKVPQMLGITVKMLKWFEGRKEGFRHAVVAVRTLSTVTASVDVLSLLVLWLLASSHVPTSCGWCVRVA
jgi:hypothetical protein